MTKILGLKPVSLIVLGFLFSSCLPTEKKIVECRSMYVGKLNKNPLYGLLQRSFYDSMKNWNGRSISWVGIYKTKKIAWKLDEVILFNIDSTRAIMFVDKVYKSRSKYDLIKSIRAEKIDTDWWFYYKGSVEFAIVRKSLEDKPSFQDQSIFIVKRFLNDGIKISVDCEFSYSYIESDTWFKKSDMNTHLNEFLKSK